MKVFNIVWRIILSVLLSFICTVLMFPKAASDASLIIWGLITIMFLGIIFASPLRKYLEYKD